MGNLFESQRFGHPDAGGHSQMMSPMMSQQPSQHSEKQHQYNGSCCGGKKITATEETTKDR